MSRSPRTEHGQEKFVKSSYRIAILVLMGSLVGLSGCVWPDGGYRGRGGEHEQNRGGEHDGRQEQRGRHCDQQGQGDCRDHQDHH